VTAQGGGDVHHPVTDILGRLAPECCGGGRSIRVGVIVHGGYWVPGVSSTDRRRFNFCEGCVVCCARGVAVHWIGLDPGWHEPGDHRAHAW
jgi:hypothetical protein